MKASRHYQDPCGIARALDRVGERWALLVVRELVLGPKRFTELRAGLPTASPNVLSQRLDELLASGVIHRRQLEPPSRSWVYQLTPWGLELDSVLLSLGRFGSRAMPVARGALSPDALLLALRTTFDARREAAPLAIELRMNANRYRIELANGELTIVRAGGDASALVSDAVVDTDAGTLRRVVFGDLAFNVARDNGSLRVEGSQRAARRFLCSFRQPSPITVRRPW